MYLDDFSVNVPSTVGLPTALKPERFSNLIGSSCISPDRLPVAEP